MGAMRALKDIPKKVILRYLLLNLPGALLLAGILFLVRTRIDLPGWFIALIIAIWLVKDAVLFPFVWKSYDWDRPGISRRMTGSTGIVKKSLAPVGLVQIDGELWKARNSGTENIIERGAIIRVVRRRGLVLSVERLDPGDSATGH